VEFDDSSIGGVTFKVMSGLTLELPPAEGRAEFNLRRWAEVLADRSLDKIQTRIETDRFGRIVMSGPASPRHGRFQSKIGSLLSKLLPDGEVITECPISTAEGVRAADVAWASAEQWKNLGDRVCFTEAPEICVEEVISPGNDEDEIREKAKFYFNAGAREVWICGAFGQITFFAPASTPIPRSRICPEFPN
jgi:Uma2 family endonuclease